MYDNYQTAGDDLYFFTVGFGAKDGLANYANTHPEIHCTEWLSDGSWQAWPTYRDAFGLGNYVPSHFIVDRDGYLRYGATGASGVPGVLTACINELL